MSMIPARPMTSMVDDISSSMVISIFVLPRNEWMDDKVLLHVVLVLVVCVVVR